MQKNVPPPSQREVVVTRASNQTEMNLAETVFLKMSVWSASLRCQSLGSSSMWSPLSLKNDIEIS